MRRIIKSKNVSNIAFNDKRCMTSDHFLNQRVGKECHLR